MTRKTSAKTTKKTAAAPVAAAPVAAKPVAAPVAAAPIAAKPATSVPPAGPVLSALSGAASISVPASARTRPSSQEVALRAYEIFRSRQGHHGDPLQDWLQAERELARA